MPPLKWFFEEDIRYSNFNGTFTFGEVNSTGRDYTLCLRNFQAFKAVHSNDTTLYRVTPMNILAFWRWGHYISEKKYKLQFRSWKEIEALRGSINNKTNWQAF